ncbi:MAG: 3-methyl-2-oxobutanoate hydroxymethyltransferase [Deltaproteobacteria bacterium]|nr:3-methyl-2-oxobutanoate hydroxymethyltransferase [Deltaproteobacteria bacterium]
MSNPITVPDIISKRYSNEKLVMLTAYDYVFAKLVDAAGVDIILVGDSLATVVQGLRTTLPVSVDEMIYHSRLVSRAVRNALVVADMPFMSYQLSAEQALESAGRFVKEADVAAVKLEGGANMAPTVRNIVRADIPVMGHVGLTPQSYHRMGGFKVQGKAVSEENKIIEDALAIEEAGAFAVVLEGIPPDLAGRITQQLHIPTIGIGAGAECSGQVLVLHDLLGLKLPEETKKPKFVKQYASLGQDVIEAVKTFAEEVRELKFPTEEYTYKRKVGKLSAVVNIS